MAVRVYTPPSGGYAIATDLDGHPLNAHLRRRNLAYHRYVVFEREGYGPHRCAWCGRHVNWRLFGSSRLVVDHINGDWLDNRSENLAVSCDRCNVLRGRGLLPA